jgi:hypothetical protein
MYTKEMLDTLKIRPGASIHISNSSLLSNEASDKYFVNAIHQQGIVVRPQTNMDNGNRDEQHLKHLAFSSGFIIREVDDALAKKRQNLESELPKVLGPDEDILFGNEHTVRMVVGYLTDAGSRKYLWGTESDIDKVLECTQIEVRWRHKLMFTDSPDQKQIEALLQKPVLIRDQDSLIRDQDLLYSISDFADEFYESIKYPTTLTHTVARQYLWKLPKTFVAWEISQSLTGSRAVQAVEAKWKLDYELAPHEISEKNGEHFSWLIETPGLPEKFKLLTKAQQLNWLTWRERYWKASTTERGLSVILVARRSSLQKQFLMDLIMQALRFEVETLDFQVHGLDRLIESAIESNAPASDPSASET